MHSSKKLSSQSAVQLCNVSTQSNTTRSISLPCVQNIRPLNTSQEGSNINPEAMLRARIADLSEWEHLMHFALLAQILYNLEQGSLGPMDPHCFVIIQQSIHTLKTNLAAHATSFVMNHYTTATNMFLGLHARIQHIYQQRKTLQHDLNCEDLHQALEQMAFELTLTWAPHFDQLSNPQSRALAYVYYQMALILHRLNAFTQYANSDEFDLIQDTCNALMGSLLNIIQNQDQPIPVCSASEQPRQLSRTLSFRLRNGLVRAVRKLTD